MSISKLIALSLTSIFLVALVQLSNANNTFSAGFDHIVNIVDPAEVVGTVVLLEDLI